MASYARKQKQEEEGRTRPSLFAKYAGKVEKSFLHIATSAEAAQDSVEEEYNDDGKRKRIKDRTASFSSLLLFVAFFLLL